MSGDDVFGRAVVLTVALVAGLFMPVSAREFVLASPQAKARVVVAEGEEGFVLRAVEDFRSDVRKIAGVELELVRGDSPREGDVFVRTESGPVESYRVETMNAVSAAYAALVAARFAAEAGDWLACRRGLTASREKLDYLLALEPERTRGKWKGWWNRSIHQRVDWGKDLPLLERVIAAMPAPPC